MCRRWRLAGGFVSLFVCVGLAFSGAAKANEFWVAIGTNIHNEPRDIYISSGPGATGTIQNFDGSFNAPFTVPPGGTVIITIPTSLAPGYTSGQIGNLGLRISADNHVIAYLMDTYRPTASNDLAVLFPTTGIGTEYVVMAYGSDLEYSQFVVAATQDATQVTITPKVATYDGKPAGVPFTITLNAFQTVQFLASTPEDLTGTIISSDKPVSVFGGHTCARVPAPYVACDHLYEQIPPVNTWGTEFGLCPTNRPGCPGDVLRVLAGTDGTTVTVLDTGGTATFNLNRGEYFTLQSTTWLDAPTYITSNHPVLVGVYMVAGSLCGSWGDPAFALVPAVNQWAKNYIFNVPILYDYNYVSVTVQETSHGTFQVDGAPAEFSALPIGETGLVCGAIPVSEGAHTISADSPFLLQIYGYDDSWGSYFSVGGQIASGGGGSLHAPETGEIIMYEDGDRRMHFMTTYQDEYGNDHITDVQLKMARGGTNPAEVILAYNVESNLITIEETYLGKTKTRGQCMPGEYKMLRGKLLNVNCLKTNVVAAEKTLKVQWVVKARKPFAGNKDLLLWVKDKDNATDGYDLAGTWYSGQ